MKSETFTYFSKYNFLLSLLNEVWLDEEERREQRERRQPIKHTPGDDDGSVPDLVSNSDRSDDSSDAESEDSSVIGFPIESEGEFHDHDGNGWQDHPVVIENDEFVPPPAAIPSPAPAIPSPECSRNSNNSSSSPEGDISNDDLAREQAAADANNTGIENNNDAGSPPLRRSRRQRNPNYLDERHQRGLGDHPEFNSANNKRQERVVYNPRERRVVSEPKKWKHTPDGRLCRDVNGKCHHFAAMDEG